MYRSNLVLSLFLLFAVPGVALAASGKAILPSSYADSSTTDNTYIKLSNITSKKIKVTVTFYHHDGTVIVDGDNDLTLGPIRGQNVNDFEDAPSTGESAKFTIDTNNTGDVRLASDPTFHWGYAVIEWKQNNSDAVVGLVAQGFRIVGTAAAATYNETAIMINGGQPF